MPVGIEVRKDGTVAFEFDERADFVRTLPVAMARRRGAVQVAYTPDTEFAIRDVGRFTGYDVQTLRRLEAEGKIPASARDANGARVWRAVDIARIREHRTKSMRLER